MEINLDGVETIECAEIEGSGVNEILLEKIVIDGGKVTLKSSSNVRYGYSAVAVLFQAP